MTKHSVFSLLMLLLIGFSASAVTCSAENQAQQLDGSKIMTMAAERNRGEDSTLSMSWAFYTGGKERHTMKCEETRKNYRGKEGLNFKSVVRYRDPAKISRRSTLTWNYTDGRRAYWYFSFGMTNAQRASNLDSIRSQAEFDFNLDEYVDINPGEERHTLVRSDVVQGKKCSVVESIPIADDKRYSKRISSIEEQSFLPLRVEYYDRKGKLAKALTITWQQVSAGIWFWKEAVVENVSEGNKTTVSVDEIKVNSGIDEREFNKVALEKVK